MWCRPSNGFGLFERHTHREIETCTAHTSKQMERKVKLKKEEIFENASSRIQSRDGNAYRELQLKQLVWVI